MPLYAYNGCAMIYHVVEEKNLAPQDLYLYPAACASKGHSTGSAATLRQLAASIHIFLFSLILSPDRRHPRQPTGYHAVLVGIPFPLLPIHASMVCFACGQLSHQQ